MEEQEEEAARRLDFGHDDLIDKFSKLLDKKFEEKLTPIVNSVQALQNDVMLLKGTADMHHASIASLTTLMQKTEADMKQQMETLRNHVDSVASAGTLTPRTSQTDGATAVFCGFRGASSQDELDKWIARAFKDAGAHLPVKTYVKGDFTSFNGVAFGKYPSTVERDVAVEALRKASLEYSGQKVWAKPEQPLETRAMQSVLFGIKKMLVEWGFDPKGLWADTLTMCLTSGSDLVVNMTCDNGVPKITYGMDWESYIMPGGVNETVTGLVEAAQEKMKRGSPSTKGLGKGKGKKGPH